ncbi:sugar phosphate isomerase/epimerase family protein [Flavitalea sp.]|nr:sugar phosphate isomerase/epimerase [Flavitalea sp.]
MSLDITYGVSTWLWTSPFSTSSIEPLFSKISTLGFDVVEIAVEDPDLIDIEAVKKGLEKYNLKAVICGAFGPTRDLTHEDPAVHQNCFKYIARCLDFCVAVGNDFFSGPMYSAVGKARLLPPEKRKLEWDLAARNLHTVCEMAAERGLKIALEPLNRFESDLVNTAEDVVRLIEAIDHPAAGVMLDGFHMNIEERDIEAAIIKAGDKLLHVQVSENYRGTPGTGQTRWDAYRRGLEAINYKGVVSIESFTTENQELAGAVCFWHPMADSQDEFASEGLKFLKQWGSSIETDHQPSLNYKTLANGK